MTAVEWSPARLSALAEEWMAERELFFGALDSYLATQVLQGTAATRQPIDSIAYEAELAGVSACLKGFLETLDSTPWYTLQQRLSEHYTGLETQYGAPGRAAAARLATLQPPAGAEAPHTAVRQALAILQQILQVYREAQGQFDHATRRFATRLASQMKYRLYAVRHYLPTLQRYWLLDGAEVASCDPPLAQVGPQVGIQRYDVAGPRGAYTCYVPEAYRADRLWPLLLALHGAGGNDEDFLWTWLKHAKSRGYILVSAKSFGPTWYPWDAQSLLLMLEAVQARYHVDPQRILLTGLSDGGSFSYDVGFAFPERFRALAVVAGILRPHERVQQAPALPVYIVHGERDQIFPVAYVRLVVEQLRQWGHQVTYRELPGFGHAYPPGENPAILDWFAGLPPPVLPASTAR
ncbi:MAG: dienelactone hydrolase family protein [Candidatus Tectimicrobiota bacterium]